MDFYDILLAKQLGGGGGGITPAIKTALLGCFSKVAWVDENGQDYYDTLMNAMYSPADLDSITAVYSGGNVPSSYTLDDLKPNLVVTAHWSDESTSTVGADYYELSGTIAVGTSTITVSYLGKTTTFNITVQSGYILQSAFTSTGTESIDTGFHYPASGTITVAVDFVTTLYTSGIATICGNKYPDAQSYLAYQQQATGGSNYTWGYGISWSNGSNLLPINNVARSVHVITMSNDGKNASISVSFKNITANGQTRTFSNTYSAIGTDSFSTNSIKIGANGDSDGFRGTVNRFIIAEGEWTSAQINSFLAGN